MTVHPLICYQVCLKIKNGSWTQTQRSNLGKGLHHYFIIIFFLFYHYFFYFTILYWFCHTSTCSRTRVPNPEPPLPPPSPYLPSGSSQCTSPKHPVSCIKPELTIHFTYDIIHVSHIKHKIQFTYFKKKTDCYMENGLKRKKRGKARRSIRNVQP